MGCGLGVWICAVNRLLIGIFVIVPALGFAADDWHSFTGVNGREMVAKVLSVDGNSVMLERKEDGRRLMIELSNLSQKDLAFLTGGGKSAEPAKPGAASGSSSGAVPVAGKIIGNTLYPRTRDEIRDGIREIGKRPKPADVSKELHKATQQLNIFRFLCGVPAEVVVDPEYSKSATDAAIACKQNGGLSHALGHSTDRCNLSSIGDFVASVPQYMADSGDNNRDARGHRAWCLNPPMGKVGFGSAGASYSAMWCMDGGGHSITGSWAYPGKGLFPLEYVHGNAWSLYGSGVKGPADKISVEVFKLTKRPEQPYGATDPIPGRPCKVLHVSTGMNNAINFEHEETNKRGIYWVRVSEGKNSDGYLVELY